METEQVTVEELLAWSQRIAESVRAGTLPMLVRSGSEVVDIQALREDREAESRIILSS